MTDYKEYVYAVYQHRSFSKAAQALYVSQPWLSATVKKVEKELEMPLFDRSTNPISLTEAGAYYMEQIERIMVIEDEMGQHFKQLRERERSELHIGSSMFFCTYVLPKLMGEFQTLYPNLTLTYAEGNSQTLSEKLLKGELDVLLEAEPPEDSKLQSVPWTTEELILAVPAHFPINDALTEYRYTFDEFLASRRSGQYKPAAPLSAFREESFLLLQGGNDSHDRSERMCRSAGFTPNAAMYLTQMMTAYYLVCEGRGVAFLRSTIPEYVSPTGSVVFYRIDDPLAVRQLYLSYPKKKLSPMGQHLIDFLQQENILLGENHT